MRVAKITGRRVWEAVSQETYTRATLIRTKSYLGCMLRDSAIKSSLQSLNEERERLKTKRNNTTPFLFFPVFFVFLLTLFYAPNPAMSIPATIFSGLFAFLIYWWIIQYPFSMLKGELKGVLLDEFMARFHPNHKYKYYPEKQHGNSIIKKSKLLTYSSCKEEDVITGNFDGCKYYLSETILRQSTGKSTVTVFDGLLLKINVNGKNYPRTFITSKPNLLKRFFSNYEKNVQYGFWYKSEDLLTVNHQLDPLFPFVQHLAKTLGDIHLRIEGDEIILLLETKMKFLDDPKPSMDSDFNDIEYFQKIGIQMNTLLFIIESLARDLDTSEIEERLELKAMELVKKSNK